MKLKNIFLKSENEFRNYVISNFKNLSRIVIFEDALDNMVFFYCFDNNDSIISAKEFSVKKFSYYIDIYEKVAHNINFSMCRISTLNNAIKLLPKI